MPIELILAEDATIAKAGDTITLKDDGTYEIKKEFAGYKDFESCKKQNQDKGNPDAYCGAIKNKVEDTKKADKPFESDPTHEKDKIKKEYDPRIEKYLVNDKTKSWSILEKFYKNNHLDPNKVLKEFINKIAICPDVTEKFEKIMDGWMREGEADTSTVEKIINSCKKENGNIEKEDDDWVTPMVNRGDLPKQKPFKKPKKVKDDWVSQMVASGDLPKQKPFKNTGKKL